MSEQNELETMRIEVCDKITRLTGGQKVMDTPIAGLGLRRWTAPTEPASYINEPSVCLSVQGAKRVLLGDETYIYNAQNYLITSIDVPVVANIIEASEEKPYLAIVYKLDLKMVSEMLADNDIPVSDARQSARGMAVSRVSGPLLNAFSRMIDLLDEPESIPVIAPLIHKEILFRLLKGEQGRRIRQIAMGTTHNYQVSKAIKWLKENFDQPLKVDDLASHASMSTSSLHQHFRMLTSMSPLQYQKWLRLHEARRLMLAESMDAANAAFQVGYESPSHFSREYKRLFGNPPLRDIKQMNEQAAGLRA